ncbi:unnamed protein product [Arctia plantaginis]|uniref:Uncharacterized protein n=1 Tax=Arctia plantaginis TaxID=874455 RepID=A0A8S1BCB1_ARCPL|nr:unnamed protein product [Arctia plantaginis]
MARSRGRVASGNDPGPVVTPRQLHPATPYRQVRTLVLAESWARALCALPPLTLTRRGVQRPLQTLPSSGVLYRNSK